MSYLLEDLLKTASNRETYIMALLVLNNEYSRLQRIELLLGKIKGLYIRAGSDALQQYRGILVRGILTHIDAIADILATKQELPIQYGNLPVFEPISLTTNLKASLLNIYVHTERARAIKLINTQADRVLAMMMHVAKLRTNLQKLATSAASAQAWPFSRYLPDLTRLPLLRTTLAATGVSITFGLVREWLMTEGAPIANTPTYLLQGVLCGLVLGWMQTQRSRVPNPIPQPIVVSANARDKEVASKPQLFRASKPSESKAALKTSAIEPEILPKLQDEPIFIDKTGKKFDIKATAPKPQLA